MRQRIIALLAITVLLTSDFPAFAADKPSVGRPNPDAVTKPSPGDFGSSVGTPGKDSVNRSPSSDGNRALAGEPVELDDTLKLLSKLMNYKGRVQGGKNDVLKKDIAALLAGDKTYRADALGCDKLNPLTDQNERIEILECMLQYTRVSAKMDTKIEVNFGTDGWNATRAKIKDAVFRVVSE